MQRTSLLAVSTVAAFMALSSAPVHQAASADGPNGTTLTVSVLQGIDSLNPFKATFSSSTQVQRLVYDTLTQYRDKDNTPGAGLAESWTTSPDSLTWTYRIRTGAKFSDGHPVTAHDVAFTYDLMLREPAARTANGNAVVNFESVSAPDDTTLVIRTKVPTATMLALDFPVVPEHVWRDVAVGEFRNDQFPVVGSGPFELVEYRVDEYLKFRANKNHWNGAPKVDWLVLRYFKNNEAAVQALRKGEIDLVGDMTPAQFSALGSDATITRNQARPARFTQLSFNPGARLKDGTPIGDGHPALTDQRVRAAIEHSIDRRVLVDKALGGLGEVGDGYLPPAYDTWKWAPESGARRDFDLAKANRILDDAGYRRGQDGVRVMSDDRPLRLRLYAPSEQAFYQQTGQHVEGWLREVGIQVELRSLSSTGLNDLTGVGNFDMYLGGWRVKPDPDQVLSVQTCDTRPDAAGTAGGTDSFYCDADYDRLYAEQAREVDLAKRADLVRRMQGRLQETSAQVVLFYPAGLEAYRADRFTDLRRRPEPNGTMMGLWGYRSATPVTAASADTAGGPPLWLAAVVVAGAGLGGVFLLRRRRRTAHERE